MNSRTALFLLMFVALPIAAIEIDPAIAKKRLADGLTWERKTTVEAYKTFGIRDPKWDADATACLEPLALDSSDNNEGRSSNFYTQQDAGRRAIEKGCSDPLVRHAYNVTRMTQRMWDSLDCYTKQSEIVKLMRDSRYHMLRKAFVEIWTAKAAKELSGDQRTEAAQNDFGTCLENARKLFVQSVSDKEIPPDRIVDLGKFLIETASDGDDREQVLGWALDGLTREQRVSAPILALAVSIYTSYAWDARGTGYADTVTAQGWALMEKRLKIAENCGEQAFIADPYIRATPLGMMSVELGQNKGLKRLDVWFNRGVALNPNDYELHSSYLYYLEPKWHGSEEKMLNFVMVVNAQKNWKAGLPLLLADMHRSLSRYEDKASVYFQRPEVWKDINGCYEEFLRRYPNAAFERSEYLRLAAYANQLAVAKEQLRILGKNVQLKAFTSGAEMQRVMTLLQQP